MTDWTATGHAAGSILMLGVSALFLVGGLVELVRWRRGVPQFVAWGYPPYWPIVTAAIKSAAGAIGFVPELRLAGLLLCLAVCVAGCVTVVRRQTREFYLPAVGMTLLSAAAVLVALGRR